MTPGNWVGGDLAAGGESDAKRRTASWRMRVPGEDPASSSPAIR
ncbi:MAG: hypothetical protein R2709_14090 [Marmoricola sp.]